MTLLEWHLPNWLMGIVVALAFAGLYWFGKSLGLCGPLRVTRVRMRAGLTVRREG